MTLSSPSPYLPSLSVLALRLAGRESDHGKLLLRTTLIAPGGEKVVLTVPLKGGSKALHHTPAAELMVSEHGNWRQVHLGAVMSTCGRLPYFPHYEPVLRSIIADTSRQSLSSVSSALEKWMLEILLPQSPQTMLRQWHANPAAVDAGRSLASAFDDEASALMHIMKFGPYATFPLLLTLDKISQTEDIQLTDK